MLRSLLSRLKTSSLRARILLVGAGGVFAALGGIAVFFFSGEITSQSNNYIYRWLTDPASRPDLVTLRQRCGDAPFILPSDGLVGLLWADPARPYNSFRRHTGLDIFGDGDPGTVPVYAVYAGYLSRPADWLSTVIIQHDDPLKPGRTIWSYYTHMASRDGSDSFVDGAFPPGTERVWVEQGTLLGYQGEYNGPSFGIALHVHVSLVKSNGSGSFLNEAKLGNTLDPSPYFGMALNITDGAKHPVRCSQ